MDKKHFFKMGKQDGLNWAKNNMDSIEDALQWNPTPGDNDPRQNPCKTASAHFESVINKYSEFKIEDYDNRISESLNHYYRGWEEGLKEFM